jgi:archaemetzincin
MKRRAVAVLLALVIVAITGWIYWPGAWRRFLHPAEEQPAPSSQPNLEEALRPLAVPLDRPKPGEWLASQPEAGQTFEEYLQADPVRKSEQLNFIALCLIGEFNPQQEKIIEQTRRYLEVFFQVPVRVTKRLPLAQIPEEARRVQPSWGDRQLLTEYVLDQVLQPNRPEEALAYLAFTASDLWPGGGWNYVFGQASLRKRTGVWSIYRFGDPARGKESYRQCLIRTLGTASHETGHILTMQHCIAYACNMNGSNSLPESDSKPLHLCPVCLHKLCWNLRVDPVVYLQQLQTVSGKLGLDEEAAWYGKAIATLRGDTERTDAGTSSFPK